jgi:uncharacterized membrane protein
MKRLKNYVLWVAVASLLGTGLLDMGIIPSLDKYNFYVDGILNILIVAGILNNPSLGKGFKDE